jgi:hypothetical protein
MIEGKMVVPCKLPMRSIPSVSIEKWHEVSEQAHDTRLPLVIPGLFEQQSRLWSPERFATQWADHEVGIVVDLPSHGVPYREKSKDYHKNMKLADFISLLHSGRSCYLNQVALGRFPELQSELDLQKLKLTRIFAVNLWVGNKTRSGLHFDNADNLFGQVYGKKKALMVSPVYSKFLYPFTDNPSKSQVDPDAPDFIRHPKSARIEVWSCELEPGDGLFMPRGWWHHITAEDISISVNCWHGDSLSEMEYMRLFLAGGMPVLWRTAYDFVWHGLLKHPYQYRLFSPPPPGIKLYDKITSRHS